MAIILVVGTHDWWCRGQGLSNLLLIRVVDAGFFLGVILDVCAVFSPDEVPAVNIVCVTVVIVVGAITRYLLRIDPQDIPEVFVQGINAGVNDCDQDGLAF